MSIQRVLGLFFLIILPNWNINQAIQYHLNCKLKTLLKQDKDNYQNIISHVKGFEEGIIECNN